MTCFFSLSLSFFPSHFSHSAAGSFFSHVAETASLVAALLEPNCGWNHLGLTNCSIFAPLVASHDAQHGHLAPTFNTAVCFWWPCYLNQTAEAMFSLGYRNTYIFAPVFFHFWGCGGDRSASFFPSAYYSIPENFYYLFPVLICPIWEIWVILPG